MTTACPCRDASAPRAYADCCGRYHAGPSHLMAPDPVSLMRSRYSAFVLDLLSYLRETWHPGTRPQRLEPNPPGLKWLGLEVRRHAFDGADHAVVEFVARNKFNGRATRLHETSRFVREGSRWFYVDAVPD